MNRHDLQTLAEERIADARALFAANRFSGAFYLAGYSVECALKAIIAGMIAAGEFPDKGLANAAWDHSLPRLLALICRTAETRGLPIPAIDKNSGPLLQENWQIVGSWSIDLRYLDPAEALKKDVKAFLDAIDDPDNGVLPWLRTYW